MAKETVEKLAPQGSVIEDVERTAGGVPIISPTSGYDGHYPVQFSDESDATFSERVLMFKSAYASAVKNEKGANSVEGKAAAKDALKAKYDIDLKALE